MPLLHVTGGLAIDLNVHLPGPDGAEDDAPPVSVFLAPGDGGLFGGWELEVDRQTESAQEMPLEQEAILESAEQAAEQTDRAGPHDLPASRVIEYDLSPVARRAHDPRRHAVVLREGASRLHTRLYARPDFAAQPIVVIYDRFTGRGMWLVKPELSEAVAGRRIVIRLDAVTGLMTVFIE